MKSIDLNGGDKCGLTLLINIVFLMHFYKMRLLLWIFKHCAKMGVSLMYMYVIGIQECLKEFGRCCNLSIKVGF